MLPVCSELDEVAGDGVERSVAFLEIHDYGALFCSYFGIPAMNRSVRVENQSLTYLLAIF